MLLSYYVAAALLVHRGCGDTLDFCDDVFMSRRFDSEPAGLIDTSNEWLRSRLRIQ